MECDIQRTNSLTILHRERSPANMTAAMTHPNEGHTYSITIVNHDESTILMNVRWISRVEHTPYSTPNRETHDVQVECSLTQYTVAGCKSLFF